MCPGPHILNTEYRHSVLSLVVWKAVVKQSISCVLSSGPLGPTALLCAGNKLTISHRSPLSCRSWTLLAIHRPLLGCLFIIIFCFIYFTLHPACSMTSGPWPWRTNPAFHSGRKREVLFFSLSYIHFQLSICGGLMNVSTFQDSVFMCGLILFPLLPLV